MPDEISDNLLFIQELGEYLREEFYKRLQVGSENQDIYFSPISRVQLKGFTSIGKKVRISAGEQSKEVTAQWDILCLLAAKSQQHDAAINIEKTLCYPLASVPLAMATCDDAQRKTAKSKLLTAALKSLIENDVEIPQTRPENKIYILDLAANIRSMGNMPDTFKDLALQLLCDIPKQYNTIYIACDTYKNRSIKSGERSLRGNSDRFVIHSGEMCILAFLTNGDNKEQMFEVIEEVRKENREK